MGILGGSSSARTAIGAAWAALILGLAAGAGAAAPAYASTPVPPGGSAASGMTGEIRGRVVNQTAPAHPVAGQRVRLEIVEPGTTSTRFTTTDPQGRFEFSGLPVGGTRVFTVQAQYGGVPYTVRAALTSAAPERDVSLFVFTATSSRAAVRGTVAFAVLELLHHAVRMSVIQRLDNATDRAVAVTDADPLVFPLPQVSPAPGGGEPVQFVDGWRDPHVRNGAITDTLPVLPGTTQVAYAVGVEPRSRTGTLRWEFPYGATDVELLADPSTQISATALRANGVVTERGRYYARWSGGPVAAGGAVSARVDGLPVFVDRWPEIAAGGLALALACGLAVALRRGPVTSP